MNTSPADWFLLFMIIFLLIGDAYFFTKLNARLTIIADDYRDFRERREALYKQMTDPERIEAELEKGAHLREMKDANRTTLPREDAGPPAVVHRPLLRGAKPGSWRPRSPGSPQNPRNPFVE